MSGVASAATGGLSALAPKATIAKVAVEGAKVLVDAGESAAKQYNETGKVSLKHTVTDAVTNVSPP